MNEECDKCVHEEEKEGMDENIRQLHLHQQM